MDLVKLKAEIIEEEGNKSLPYKDTVGYWTAGIGHNLSAHDPILAEHLTIGAKYTFSDVQIDAWYLKDVQAAIDVCHKYFPTFDTIPDPAQRALVNLAFDLMDELKDWKHLQANVRAGGFQGAALDIMNSKFAKQCPNRARRLAIRITERI